MKYIQYFLIIKIFDITVKYNIEYIILIFFLTTEGIVKIINQFIFNNGLKLDSKDVLNLNLCALNLKLSKVFQKLGSPLGSIHKNVNISNR